MSRDQEIVSGSPLPEGATVSENWLREWFRRLSARIWHCKIRSWDVRIEAFEARSYAGLDQFDVAVGGFVEGSGGIGSDLRVINGLGRFTGPSPDHGEPSSRSCERTEMAEVRHARLPLTIGVRTVALHEGRQISVSSWRTMDPPKVHQVRWNGPGANLAVRTGWTIGEPAVTALDSDVAISAPRVSPASKRWRELPHSRRGVHPGELSRQDEEGFLNQAESLRGVSAGQGEIIAVFRKVPVEMITRARYSDSSGGLIYALASPMGRSRTRIHDVAAVRDKTTGKVHLVPHKTRFDEAVFS